jgi:hypothetical protein
MKIKRRRVWTVPFGRRPLRQTAAGQVASARGRAVLARDAGLARISRVTRWLTAAVVALSCALAVVAANAFSGQAAGSAPAGAESGSRQKDPAPELWAPSQGPAATLESPAVTSGGS